MATQFHPEKSGENGLKMYKNFLKLAAVTREDNPDEKPRQ